MLVCDNCLHSFVCKYMDTMTPQDKCRCYKNRNDLKIYLKLVNDLLSGKPYEEIEAFMKDHIKELKGKNNENQI